MAKFTNVDDNNREALFVKFRAYMYSYQYKISKAGLLIPYNICIISSNQYPYIFWNQDVSIPRYVKEKPSRKSQVYLL